jgi:tetratricopeptide (TPR) repeat protein
VAKGHKQNQIKKNTADKQVANNKESSSRLQALQQAFGFEWAKDLDQAERIYLELIRKNDRDTAANLQLALLYARNGRPALAVPLLQKLDQVDDYDAPTCNSIGALWQFFGLARLGLTALERAVELVPASVEFRLNLGVALLDSALPLPALEHIEKCVEADPTHALSLQRLGMALRACGRLQEAVEAFQRATVLEPAGVDQHAHLAMTYVDLTRFDDAIDAWKRVLEINPAFSVAHLRLAHLRKRGHDIAGMESLYAKTEKNVDRINLAFGLGKAFEDVGNAEQAFHHLVEGNRLKRKQFQYSPEQMHGMFEKLKSTFTPEFLRGFSDAGVQDDAPIFILGMPRSGTSLTEQILASHPDVFGAGELRTLATLCTAGSPRSPKPFPDYFEDLESSDWRELGEKYIAELRIKSPDAKRITDKMPQNFRYLGVIGIILPQARIIHCQRDPLDNCWSLYKNLFGEGHPFTYDLDELGRFYNDYQLLMKHWNTVLPGRIYNLSYEELVASPRTEIPALLEFCGLSFDQRCIDFHKNERMVETMSAAQVKRPINSDSVKSSSLFKEQLAPLARALY